MQTIQCLIPETQKLGSTFSEIYFSQIYFQRDLLLTRLPKSCPKVDPAPPKRRRHRTLAPRFCAEWSDREIRSSHGGCFRDHFGAYVPGAKS